MGYGMLPEVIISEHSSSSLHKRRLKFSHAKKKPHVMWTCCSDIIFLEHKIILNGLGQSRKLWSEKSKWTPHHLNWRGEGASCFLSLLSSKVCISTVYGDALLVPAELAPCTSKRHHQCWKVYTDFRAILCSYPDKMVFWEDLSHFSKIILNCIH